MTREGAVRDQAFDDSVTSSWKTTAHAAPLSSKILPSWSAKSCQLKSRSTSKSWSAARSQKLVQSLGSTSKCHFARLRQSPLDASDRLSKLSSQRPGCSCLIRRQQISHSAVPDFSKWMHRRQRSIVKHLDQHRHRSLGWQHLRDRRRQQAASVSRSTIANRHKQPLVDVPQPSLMDDRRNRPFQFVTRRRIEHLGKRRSTQRPFQSPQQHPHHRLLQPPILQPRNPFEQQLREGIRQRVVLTANLCDRRNRKPSLGECTQKLSFPCVPVIQHGIIHGYS